MSEPGQMGNVTLMQVKHSFNSRVLLYTLAHVYSYVESVLPQTVLPQTNICS